MSFHHSVRNDANAKGTNRSPGHDLAHVRKVGYHHCITGLGKLRAPFSSSMVAAFPGSAPTLIAYRSRALTLSLLRLSHPQSETLSHRYATVTTLVAPVHSSLPSTMAGVQRDI
jgi:hypothetical protein